jgi:phosphate transport system protein
MTRHLQREIDRLKKSLLALASEVERRLRDAVSAVLKRDAVLAQRVIAGDAKIDADEVDLEEGCLKILALHQPVAIDLRFVVAALKINNDLERIADLAVNIAERAQALAGLPSSDLPFDLIGMSENVQRMLRQALDAMVNLNLETARQVLTADAAVDAAHRQLHLDAYAAVQRDAAQFERCVLTLSVSRNLERIGDLATNIAEDVIYMIEGDIVRHHH